MEKPGVLRANSATIKWALDSLDAQQSPMGQSPGSPARRFPYRISALRIETQQQGGSIARFVVPTRNIGRDGLSFLVGRLIYPDTICRIDLITTRNYWQSVVGSVVECRYVPGTGSVYEADVRFQQPIDVSLFVAQAIRVRVLLVDDSPTSRALLTKRLRDLNADVVARNDGRQAVTTASSQHFDLVLMDMDMPVMDGFAATRELRAQNYTQPIVAVTSLTSVGDRERCLAAGCDDYLAKPPVPESIAALIDRLRPEPLVSSLASDHPELVPLIDEYVAGLRTRAMDIQKAHEAADIAALTREARLLRAEAPSLGFEPIGAVAAELEQALRQSLPVPDIRMLVGRLVRLCCVARPASVAGTC